MKKLNEDKAQGHWLLAKMGKRVLRPGGKELTLKLIDSLNIDSLDDVVEFAPGLGFTASITLKKKPKTYIAVELNKEAFSYLQKVIYSPDYRIINANAKETGLADAVASKVYGEAMLTMQSEKQKSEIVKEAYRILKPGGLYGIHEIALVGDLSRDNINAIYQDMADAIKTNARPLSVDAWKDILSAEGFNVKDIYFSPMHLVEPKRIFDDEGFFRAIRIFFNIFTHPAAARRIRKMRSIFHKYEANLSAVAIIAEKI